MHKLILKPWFWCLIPVFLFASVFGIYFGRQSMTRAHDNQQRNSGRRKPSRKDNAERKRLQKEEQDEKLREWGLQ